MRVSFYLSYAYLAWVRHVNFAWAIIQSQTQSKVNKKKLRHNGGQKDNWGLKLGHKLWYEEKTQHFLSDKI